MTKPEGIRLGPPLGSAPAGQAMPGVPDRVISTSSEPAAISLRLVEYRKLAGLRRGTHRSNRIANWESAATEAYRKSASVASRSYEACGRFIPLARGGNSG